MSTPAFSATQRERQILAVVARLGRATVADVLACLDGLPTYSTVRTQLTRLEHKGYLEHTRDEQRYVYMLVPQRTAAHATLRWIADLFFGGSRARLALHVLDEESLALADEDVERLRDLLARARHSDKAAL